MTEYLYIENSRNVGKEEKSVREEWQRKLSDIGGFQVIHDNLLK